MEYDNNKLTNAKLRGHREIITEGFIPVSFGPSGKTLAGDLIFKEIVH